MNKARKGYKGIVKHLGVHQSTTEQNAYNWGKIKTTLPSLAIKELQFVKDRWIVLLHLWHNFH